MTSDQNPSDMTITDILAAFETYDGTYKRQAVDAALQQKEAITPHLLDVLDRLLENPDAYPNDYDAHIYALMLLGAFREPQAHQRIIDLFSLPSQIVELRFGDMITEDLPMLLSNTCGGSIASIKRFALNQDAHEYCRGSAVSAIVFTVFDWDIPREEALTFFGDVLREAVQSDSDYDSDPPFVYSEIAVAIYDLYPEELMDVVEAAFAKDLIDSFLIDLNSFKDVLAEGKDARLKDTEERIRQRLSKDIHGKMAWWASFQPTRESDRQKPSSKPPGPQKPPAFAKKTDKGPKKKKAFWQL